MLLLLLLLWDTNHHMFSHKRHRLQDPFDNNQHAAKRRLVDHLNGLSLALNSNTHSPADTDSTSKPSLFGSFTKEQLDKPLFDPNKVIIKNIDKFLNENNDQFDDLISEKNLNLIDLRNAGLNNLIISSGMDLKKAWKNLSNISNISNLSDNPNNNNLNDLIYKLIWDEYVSKYFSLIKYYNPIYLVWNIYLQWEKNKSNNTNSSSNNNQIIELDDDEMMIDDNNSNIIPDHNTTLSSREQSLHNATSSYGSYYTHDENDNSFPNNNTTYYSHYHYDPDSMIEDVDDDIMMED